MPLRDKENSQEKEVGGEIKEKRRRGKPEETNVLQHKPKITNNKEGGATQKGYMDSQGKPRQPRQTRDNKAGTLRYEQETETWHCKKCDKQYSKQNARSAKNHANAHTKQEAKQKKEYEQELIRQKAQLNQGESG